MLTVLPANLVLRDDNLSGVRVIGARDRVLADADGADDLAFLEHTLLALERLARAEVARVADDLLRLDGLRAAAHADELAIRASHDLVDGLVKHVGTTVDGAQTSERLGQLAKAVEGVDVGRLAVASHGRCVEDDAVVGWARRLGDVARSRLSIGEAYRWHDTHSSSRYNAMAWPMKSWVPGSKPNFS